MAQTEGRLAMIIIIFKYKPILSEYYDYNVIYGHTTPIPRGVVILNVLSRHARWWRWRVVQV
jgi:hypothetical protein